jgi:hypothetical protein
LNPEADTSVVFMRDAARRGHEVATCGVGDLSVGPGGRAQASWVAVRAREGRDWYTLGASGSSELSAFDVVWMRKDPPYDLNYFFVTHLLDLVSPGTLVVNSPRGLREVTEKLFILRFPDLCPESLVSRNIKELMAFREKLGGEMIIKPLDGCGGEGVFHTHQGRPQRPDDSRNGHPPRHRLPDCAALHPGGARRRQAHHRGGRRAGRGGPARAPALRVARELPRRRHRGQDADHGPRARHLRADRASPRGAGDRVRGHRRDRGLAHRGERDQPDGDQEINRLDGVQLERQVLDAVLRRHAGLAS